ncbi:MAG: putative sulfate/molybdate transporter [Nitrososphaerales archaeon]
MLATTKRKRGRSRFRWTVSELSGSLGDLGIFIPIVVGLIAVNGMNSSQLLTTFGIFFVANGLAFGLPMPVEPMKAIAGIAIANEYAPDTIMLAGMLTGLAILALSLTGLLTRFQKLVPKAVVRGIQMGLGISLAVKGLTMISRTPMLGFDSIGLAALSSILIFVSFRRRFPATLVLVMIGAAVALMVGPEFKESSGFNLWVPAVTLPLAADFMLSLNLSLAQLPLTLTNSLIATYGLLHVRYREKAPSIKSIGKSVGLMSSISPLIGGIGMCHGAGGVAAWHRFGARTAGSMLIFGAALMLLGVFAGSFVTGVMQAFPLSILGTLLVLVAFELARQSKDIRRVGDVLVVAATALVGFTYNMLAGVLIGLAVAYALQLREKRRRK